ncbi:unnamed protein product [Rotaria sordida]|uniref:Mpv17-like protein 2 n=1 Tax=Rotaria sordida TaxID=392033 RepID=A0A814NIW1_9BILA|nr:unnamed protein product [Rotaria sordida]CAF1092884.1 unnamed protein product [Rotaria sordida]
MIVAYFGRYKLFLLNITSASGLLTLGDYCAQIFYDKKKTLDKKRLFAACITGAALGIEGHYWYKFLDRIIAKATWHNAFKKVLCDQTVAAPIYTTTYIIGTSILEGRTSLNQLKDDTKQNFIPLYIADCVVFIPTQLINFRYISAYYHHCSSKVSFNEIIEYLHSLFSESIFWLISNYSEQIIIILSGL